MTIAEFAAFQSQRAQIHADQSNISRYSQKLHSLAWKHAQNNTPVKDLPCIVMPRIAMNRFAVTSHGSLVVISISIFMTKQGMRVGKLRSKLNRPNEELYGALVVMTQWKTIPNSTPRLQKFYTELHVNAHISIHLSSDTDASTKTAEVQHNLTLFVVLVWKLGRKIIFSHMGRGATRLDGAWGKKQAWRLLVGNWGLAEANVLYWRKYLWHCLDFSAFP